MMLEEVIRNHERAQKPFSPVENGQGKRRQVVLLEKFPKEKVFWGNLGFILGEMMKEDWKREEKKFCCFPQMECGLQRVFDVLPSFLSC